jgi:hypothetical protein
VYTIKAGEMPDWLREWSQQIRPLRERLGFSVVGVWMVADTNRFIWIIRYEGPLTWQEAEAGYYGSPERIRLDPDPARHIETSEQWLMTSSACAPRPHSLFQEPS